MIFSKFYNPIKKLNFKDLNLDPSVLKAIEELGFTSPTPIQEQAIPKIKEGFDLLASAQTGTGKTAAFLLPALNQLLSPPKLQGYGPRVLILVPTRELAMQVATECGKYCKYLSRTKIVSIYGGVPYPPQNRALSSPYEILIATPGRLIDHIQRGRIKFSRVELFILDEADRMLDMGFIQPVEEIASMLPKPHQTLLFSATLHGSILNLSKKLLHQPINIQISPIQTKHEQIEERLHLVDDLNHKYGLLSHLLKDPTLNQAIVFTATKRHADKLSEKLFDEGHRVAALHGDMNQRERTRSINKFRKGEIQVLVATDIAARGIDVLTITHVINFDLPRAAEDYIHRIGRTGRAGATGVALSFASQQEISLVRQIEKLTGQKMTTHVIKGLEPKSKTQSNSPHNNKRGSGRPFRRFPSKSNRRFSTPKRTHTT